MPRLFPRPTRDVVRAAEREKVILESAIRFFAEHGFEGQTRELAKRIGITQPDPIKIAGGAKALASPEQEFQPHLRT